MGIDVATESTAKQKRQKQIEEKQIKEANAASAWSLGLSFLGGVLFGPAGYVAGQKLGEWGADLAYDWESMEIDPGKFDKQTAIDYNEDLAKAAKDQTWGQVVNTVIDLGKMYVQAGGLKEGFDPTIGGGDWTTFGTGEDAWTVFGEGTWADKIPFAKTLPGDQALFPGGGTKIWEKGGLKQLQSNLLKGGNLEDIYLQNMTPLGKLLLQGASKEEPLPEGEEVPSSSWPRT